MMTVFRPSKNKYICIIHLNLGLVKGKTYMFQIFQYVKRHTRWFQPAKILFGGGGCLVIIILCKLSGFFVEENVL